MKAKRIQEAEPATYVLVLDEGDELIDTLQTFAHDQGLQAASFTGIGAFSDVVLRYFDRQARQFHPIPVREQVEALCLTGNLAPMKNGDVRAHVHAVVGRRDGSTLGGDVGEAHVWPTLEIIVTESPTHLHRVYDEATGLALIDLR